MSFSPLGWGGGKLAPTGWTLQPVGGGPAVNREESMRARALMLLAASEGDPIAELDAWRMPLGLPGSPFRSSLAAWLWTWCLQRPLQLQGFAHGYPVAGHAVLALVDEISADVQAQPTRRWGVIVDQGPFGGTALEGPAIQVGVEFRWADSDPLTVVRCPPLDPAGWPAAPPRQPMPDAWRQVDVAEGTLGVEVRWLDAPAEVAAVLEAWGPGHVDAGLGPWPAALVAFLMASRAGPVGHGGAKLGETYVPLATVSCALCLESWDMELAKVPAFVTPGCAHCKGPTSSMAVYEKENGATRNAGAYLPGGAPTVPTLPAPRPVTPGESAKLDAKLATQNGARRPSPRRA